MILPARKIVRRPVPGLDGVLVRVRRPSWKEAQQLRHRPEADEEATFQFITGLIDGFENLEMEGVGPITTIDQALEHLDIDSIAAIMRAVRDAGATAESEAGESGPQSSGAANT